MISIIIPVYNVAPYLVTCLDSCFAQTHSDIEVIAINDGSTDQSSNILETYASKEARLRVIDQSNSGVVKARQVGIDNAKGDFIMFVDSDDTIAPNAIEVLFNQFNNEIDIVVGHYQEYFPSINYTRQYPFNHKSVVASIDFIDLILLKKIQWGLWAKLYRKSLFENLNSTNFKLGEDACALVQLVMQSGKVAFVEKVVYTYLQRSDSAVHLPGADKVGDIYNFRLWIANYLTQNRYNKLPNINYFIVDGYVECLFFGGSQQVSSKINRKQISLLCKDIAMPLLSWQKAILLADKYKLCTITVAILRFFQKLKFHIKLLKSRKC